MAVSVRGRSTMALYSSETSLDCHRVRFVLAEKGINVEIVNVSEDESAAADLAELNPYNEAPTLVDRDLVLYDAGVINDYLDERYPHPPLMPVDPVSRAQLQAGPPPGSEGLVFTGPGHRDRLRARRRTRRPSSSRKASSPPTSCSRCPTMSSATS